MITNNKIPIGQVESEVSQTITNGVTNKAPSEDAVFDALENYTRIIYKDFTASAALTGTTAITLINSALIPANTVAVGNEVEIKTRAQRDTATGTGTVYLYYNTSASLSGATLIGFSAGAVAFHPITRSFYVKSASDSETINSATNVNNDFGTNAGTSMSSFNINWTNDVYIIQAYANAAVGNSTTSRGMIIKLS
jgi:hypothetical protein